MKTYVNLFNNINAQVCCDDFVFHSITKKFDMFIHYINISIGAVIKRQKQVSTSVLP